MRSAGIEWHLSTLTLPDGQISLVFKRRKDDFEKILIRIEENIVESIHHWLPLQYRVHDE